MAVTQYMLDTCICSFIQREKPLQLLQRLQDARDQRHRIVISAITYAEMRFGATSRKASPTGWPGSRAGGAFMGFTVWNSSTLEA